MTIVADSRCCVAHRRWSQRCARLVSEHARARV